MVWRHRILWLFGLIAGGAGGIRTGGGGPWMPQDATAPDGMPLRELQRVEWWLQDNLELVLAVGALAAMVGFALFVLSVAAKGGLIHLVNEAEEGRPVRGLDGWATGFRMWFRVFGIGLVLFVPYVFVLLVITAALFVPIAAPLIAGESPSPEVVAGLCGGFVFGGLVLIVGGIVVGLLEVLAVRHAVLDGSGVFASIGGAWADLRVRFKDVLVTWLLVVAVGIAFGIVLGTIVAVFGLGIVAFVAAGSLPLAIVAGVALSLAVLLPVAIFEAFTSAIWTVFFRRLTGRELLPPKMAAGYSPPLSGYEPGEPPPPPAPAPVPPGWTPPASPSQPLPPPGGFPIAEPPERQE